MNKMSKHTNLYINVQQTFARQPPAPEEKSSHIKNHKLNPGVKKTRERVCAHLKGNKRVRSK